MKNLKPSLPILSFPILLTIGIFLIPVVPDYANHELAAHAVSKTTRWFLGHILAAVGFGLGVLAILTIDKELRRAGSRTAQSKETGNNKTLGLAPHILLMVAIGAGLYAAGLGADGIGPVAVMSAGASPTLFFNGSGWWVSGTFMAGTAFFGIGQLLMVIDLNQDNNIKGNLRYLTFISALVFMAAPAIPSGWGLYGVAVASIGIYIPIAISLSSQYNQV